MESIPLQLLLILALILLNGALALSEIAVVAARRPRLERWAAEGDRGARRALALTKDKNRFLSTVQVGISLVGILAGAYGGARLARPLGETLAPLPVVGAYPEQIAFALVVGAITYLTLVLGELVPKRIALAAPERAAAVIARPMHLLSTIAGPVVLLLAASTNLVLRLLRVRGRDDPPMTEEEIAALVERSARAGELEDEERHLVERVFALDEARVDAIMTPRDRIVWLDANAPADQLAATIGDHRHSRYLLCDGRIDALIGMVHGKDVWVPALAGKPVDLRALATDPLFVDGATDATDLLALFRETGIHVALVTDRDGTIRGMVTLNDVMEEITGELDRAGEPQATRREDGSWLVDAWLPLDRLADTLDVTWEQPSVDRFRTAAGLVIGRLGRSARAGDAIEAPPLRLEVVDTDGPRVDKLLVSRL
jgi:putative hemolysin